MIKFVTSFPDTIVLKIKKVLVTPLTCRCKFVYIINKSLLALAGKNLSIHSPGANIHVKRTKDNEYTWGKDITDFNLTYVGQIKICKIFTPHECCTDQDYFAK